jgi:hypothetical protein
VQNPLEIRTEHGRIVFGIEAGMQVVGQKSAYWNLSQTYPGATPFNPDLSWGEGYVKPSISGDYAFGDAVRAYGELSLVGSGTAGIDVFASGNTGRVLPETAFGGIRVGRPGGTVSVDLSGGRQPYAIGTGMVIQAGASNGFERGALIFSPRTAWASTAIGRISAGPATLEGFYLAPDDLASNPTHTRIAGANLKLDLGAGQMAGVAYARVLASDVPSVQAGAGPLSPPLIVPQGRQGLEVVNAYARWNPLARWTSGFWVAGELALERNDDIDLRAWGGRAEIGQTFTDLPWQPTLSYAFSTFSGDNPATARNERFDPLYFDGAPGAWASGGNASLVLINSNVNLHRISLVLNPTKQDIVSLRYWRASANQLASPLQFGQATRFVPEGDSPGLISGVTTAHLSDGVLAEYTRVVNPHAFVTLGAAASRPGAGIRELQAGAGPLWLGGFANVVVRY